MTKSQDPCVSTSRWPRQWIMLLLCLAYLKSSAAQPVSRLGILSVNSSVVTGIPANVGEPIIIRVTIKNDTNEGQKVSLGNNLQSNIYFGVSDAAGHSLGPPAPQTPVAGFSSLVVLGPKESKTEYFLLNQRFEFKDAGVYSIKTQLLSNYPLRPISEDKLILRVDVFDRHHLEKTCQQLLEWSLPKPQNIPIDVALKSLFSIRNEVALPYFDYLAKEYSSAEACLAIRRVKTKRAEQLIKVLAARQDDVGKAAQRALKLPLEEPKPQTNIYD